jgi:hypothetical protein
MFFSFYFRALFLGALLIPSLGFAENWQSIEWLKLVRYHKTFLGGWVSEADDLSFFIHPEGRTRPDLEYKALFNAISEKPGANPEMHALCRFPARSAYISRSHPELKPLNVNCEEFSKFKNRVSAKAVALVFSSYYLNNPASSFGHTFIRLEKEGYEKRQEGTTTDLLDTGINYGAVTGNANPLIFAIGAFIGLFYGSYNAIPYYYKVREYNDFESRDLWTYHLEFTQPEIDQLVRHIWELGHANFKYFFLTENCSYHALTMLEAIRPELDLVKFLPDRYIIPTDTLKTAVDQKIVKGITYRPSASTYFYHYLKKLNLNQRELMKEVLAHKKLPDSLDARTKALIYDASLSFIDYKYAAEILKNETKAQNLKRPILLARANVPIRSATPDFSLESKVMPHEGHDSGRFTFGGSRVDNKSVANLAYKFAFHDILDYQKAYIPNSRVDMFSFRSTMTQDHFTLTDFYVADYFSIGSFDEYTKSFSWKLKLGEWQTYQKAVSGFSTQGALGGYGYSYNLKFLTTFILVSIETSYISEYYHKVKLAYGGDIGVLINFNEHLRMSSTYEHRFYPWEENFARNEIRLSNVNHGLGLFYNQQTKQGFAEFGANYMVYLK